MVTAGTASERRRFNRVRFQLPVRFKPVASTVKEHTGELGDVSLSGVRLLLNEADPCHPGTEIELVIDSLTSSEPITAQGTIRWRDPSSHPDWSWEIGVALTGMAPPHWDRWFKMLNWA